MRTLTAGRESRGFIPFSPALEPSQFCDTLWPYEGVMSMKGAACFLLLAFLPAMLPAQSTFGTILGTVTDPSGALVPGVQVTVTNLDENISREATTDAQGNYEVSNLKAAHYRVAAKKQGFHEFSATDLLLEARQVLRVNVALQVGELVETVTVQGAAAVVTTD